MRTMVHAAVALLTLVAGPALAQTAEFEAAGVRYSVPAPEGYCSTGPAIDSYLEAQRRGNPRAVPDAIFARCGIKSMQPYDFFAVVVKREGPAIERDTMIAQMRAELPEALRKETLVSEAARQGVERRAREAFDTSLSVNAGIKPVGLDDFCGYIAGVIQFRVEGQAPVNVATIGCATSIGGRPIFVFRYTSDIDAAAAAKGLPDLKRFAQSIGARK